MGVPQPIDQQFASYTHRDANGCLVWTGNLSKAGYGRISYRGVRMYAHRAAYQSLHGPIPTGLVIDHLCRNRACCEPAHLEAVTIGENALRGVGACAVHAKKTACPKGHPYTVENTYVPPSGGRHCLTCMSARKPWRHQTLPDPEDIEAEAELACGMEPST